MEVRFDIKKYGYTNIGDLWFKIDGNKTDKINEFLLQIKAPDSDDWSDIRGYYFGYETINEYGSKNKYIEYVNCFEVIANKLCTEKDLHLFNLNINKEFEDVDKELLKNYFLKINEIIINKVKMCFKYYFEENSDDENNSSDNESSENSDDENNSSDNESN